MKNLLKLVALVAIIFSSVELKAQSLSDIFNSSTAKDLIESVTGGQAATTSNIEGEWNYVQPAVKLESENLLGSAAGTAMSSKVESTLAGYLAKVGIKAGAFKCLINADGTFAFAVGSRQLKGNYTIDSANNKIHFSFKAFNSVKWMTISAEPAIMGNTMGLLFTADKLLNLVSSIVGSNNSGTVGMLLKNYKGVLMGFEFSRTAGTGSAKAEATSTAVESVGNALKGLFGR